MLFTGSYEHSIDAKHRLAIPAEIRGRLNPDRTGEAFYIVRGPNGALWLWPERTFEAMAGDIRPDLLPSTEIMDFDYLTFPEAKYVEIDKAGRILLPEDKLKEAGITSKVVILGMRNHLELRDPEEWERIRTEKEARRAEILHQARRMLRPDSHSEGEKDS